MKKRLIALFTAAAVACTSTTAYAHTGDVFGGKYTDRTKANFYVRIHSSAEKSVFSFSNVYMYGEEWNGISSNVKLYVQRVGESVSTDLNQINVIGVQWDIDRETKKITMGRTFAYDRYGNECGLDDDWYYSRIGMNVSEDASDQYICYCPNYEDRLAMKRKVFLHELGHALKLAHPVQNSNYSMHEYKYDGYPKAIMNEGGLDSPEDRPEYVSLTIADHDKSCLIAKWGK